MQAGGEEKPYDDINITPMLDLAYVLLVIFILMCTASVQGLKANIPKGSSGPPPKNPPKTKAISINNEGKITLDTVPCSVSELEQRLAAFKAQNPSFPVVVKGDSGTQYQVVMEVIGVLAKLNITQVGLATKPRPK